MCTDLVIVSHLSGWASRRPAKLPRWPSWVFFHQIRFQKWCEKCHLAILQICCPSICMMNVSKYAGSGFNGAQIIYHLILRYIRTTKICQYLVTNLQQPRRFYAPKSHLRAIESQSRPSSSRAPTLVWDFKLTTLLTGCNYSDGNIKSHNRFS